MIHVTYVSWISKVKPDRGEYAAMEVNVQLHLFHARLKHVSCGSSIPGTWSTLMFVVLPLVMSIWRFKNNLYICWWVVDIYLPLLFLWAGLTCIHPLDATLTHLHTSFVYIYTYTYIYICMHNKTHLYVCIYIYILHAPLIGYWNYSSWNLNKNYKKQRFTNELSQLIRCLMSCAIRSSTNVLNIPVREVHWQKKMVPLQFRT